MDGLGAKSPALKKNMEPRLAYKYGRRMGGSVTQASVYGGVSRNDLASSNGNLNSKSDAKFDEVLILDPIKPQI